MDKYTKKVEQITDLATKRKNCKLEKRILRAINRNMTAYTNYRNVKRIIDDEKYRIIYMYLTNKKSIKEEDEEKYKKFKDLAENDLKHLRCAAWGGFITSFKEFCEENGIDTEFREVRIPGTDKKHEINFEYFFIFHEDYHTNTSKKIEWKNINPLLTI